VIAFIDTETFNRLEKLAAHPRSETKNVDAFLRGIAESGANPATFADMLQMQFDAVHAAMTFAEQREAAGDGRNFLRILVAISQTFGYVLGRVSRMHPSPGQDVATAVYQECARQFADSLGENIAWTDPPPPSKQPTTDTSSSSLN
jgi:hypothetical protein